MKNIYLMFLLVFGFMFMPKINAQTEEVTISINERLPKAYIKGSQAPDFKGHFIVRVDGTRRDLTDGELNIGGFDVNTLGTYTITATIGEVSNAIEVKVIEADTEAPIITINKAFLDKNDQGQTPWSSQETMISLMARFTIYDEVDGLIPATESMFKGIEKVVLTEYGEEYTIWFDVADEAGNLAIYGEIKLLIINTLSSILVEFDEDLPVEFIVNSDAPNFNDYFKVIDVKELDPSKYQIRLGGFDITTVGEYNITLFYQRQYIFDSNRDIARVTKVFKVIEADNTSPEITTYQIDDNLNELGQLVWAYVNNPNLTKEQQIQDHKMRFMERFVKVKDNVDGVIAVNESMFTGLDEVDFFQIDTEFIVTFEVSDKAGNVTSKEVKLFVADIDSPFITNFQNRYYRSSKGLDILEVIQEVDVIDNYDKSDSILKIVIIIHDAKVLVESNVHDYESGRYADRYTPEQIKNAAQSTRYELTDKDGTYTVRVKAFLSDNPSKMLVDKDIQISITGKKIDGLHTLQDTLDIDRSDKVVAYYITNYEPKKNGEFALMVEAIDTSNNISPARTLRIVIENGPSLMMILVALNVAAIVVFGAAIGIYLGVRKARRRA